MADHFDLIVIGSDLSGSTSNLHSPQLPLTVKSSVEDLCITIPINHHGLNQVTNLSCEQKEKLSS